jgi:hypothetical protein
MAHYQQTAPVDVVKIAEDHFKISVWEDSLAAGISGKLFVDTDNGGKSGFSIVVNIRDAYTRKRFTIAHELGHFILHRQQLAILGGSLTDDAFYRSGLSNTQESEANRFAADILMPYTLIQKLVANGVTGVAELATTFKVSEAAMSIRLGIPIP